jgi:hypothetical protein
MTNGCHIRDKPRPSRDLEMVAFRHRRRDKMSLTSVVLAAAGERVV